MCLYTHTHKHTLPPQKKYCQDQDLKGVPEMSPTATEQRSTPLPLAAGKLLTWFQFPSFPCQVIIFSAS